MWWFRWCIRKGASCAFSSVLRTDVVSAGPLRLKDTEPVRSQKEFLKSFRRPLANVSSSSPLLPISWVVSAPAASSSFKLLFFVLPRPHVSNTPQIPRWRKWFEISKTPNLLILQRGGVHSPGRWSFPRKHLMKLETRTTDFFSLLPHRNHHHISQWHLAWVGSV